MNSPDTNPTINDLIQDLKKEFPTISFQPHDGFLWDSEHNVVYYDDSSTKHGSWLILHEVGHMISRHRNYASDMGLLKIEAEAWSKAKEIAKKHGITINEDYIQDCMDSYRDWVHKRSTCPVCGQNGIEDNTGKYRCINCLHKWQVTVNRFCRVYRKSKDPDK